MKNHKITFTLLLALLTCCQTWASTAASKVIEVRNELDFFKAMGSNRTIRVAAGVELNLSQGINDDRVAELLGIKEELSLPSPSSWPKNLVYRGHETDGWQPFLAKFSNLTIEGSGTNQSRIVIEPRYAYVLSFISCNNITLRNLEIGHTEEGYCSGGVLNFEECRNVSIENCVLYGCGTEGVTVQKTQHFVCKATNIHHCTYSIMTVIESEDVLFDQCIFHENKEYGLLCIRGGCSDVRFNQCSFIDNVGELFEVYNPITMTNCQIYHPTERRGDMKLVTTVDCTFGEDFSENPGLGSDGPGEDEEYEEDDDPHANDPLPTFYHAYSKKQAVGTTTLTYAVRGRAVAGEIRTVEPDFTDTLPIYGYIDNNGELVFNAFRNDMAFYEFKGRIAGNNIELYDVIGEFASTLKPEKKTFDYSIDRITGGYGSPYDEDVVYTLRPQGINMAGIYRYELTGNRGQGNINIYRTGENDDIYNITIDIKCGNEQYVVNGEVPMEENHQVFLNTVVDGKTVIVKLEYYENFIIVSTIDDRSNVLRGKMKGIFVNIPGVG